MYSTQAFAECVGVASHWQQQAHLMCNRVAMLMRNPSLPILSPPSVHCPWHMHRNSGHTRMATTPLQ